MFVKELQLENYRNYTKRTIGFGEGLNVILGLNGSGKTNILEAIYLLSIARSYRTKHLSELISFGGDYFFTECNARLDGRDQDISLSYSLSNEKKMKVNGIQKKRTEDFTAHLAIVSFSPDDLKIVKGEPEERRIFLNDILIQTSKIYTHNKGRYIYSLRQRNNLLKKVRDGFGSIAELEAIEELMIKYGSPLVNERWILVDALRDKAREIYSGFLPHRVLEVTYGPNFMPEILPEKLARPELFATSEPVGGSANPVGAERTQLIERAMRSAFEKGRAKEIEGGSTAVGPHRDEVNILFNGKPLKQFGSQGEQRTAVLALKLAELEYMEEVRSEKPILLLDDVLSELDEIRRKELLKKVKSGYQTILTTTNTGYFTQDDLSEATIIRTTDS